MTTSAFNAWWRRALPESTPAPASQTTWEDQIMSAIEISVDVRNNTVVCGVNGGNVLGSAGTQVVWRAENDSLEFTLEFFRLAAEPQRDTPADCKSLDVRRLPRWPFKEPEPKLGIVGPTREFAGTFKEDTDLRAYKYYVTVENLRLDPIVIVD
jgi:hypothetical protein